MAINIIPDADGLHQLSLLGRDPAQVTKSKENEDVSKPDPTKPSVEDPFSNPEYWGLGTQQQQPQPQIPNQQQYQQAPQPQQAQQPTLVAGRPDPNNPLALPKDEATLQRMIQAGVYNVIGGLAQTNAVKQQRLERMKKAFLESPQHRPWYPVAEDAFNDAVNSGMDIEDAAKKALATVANLAKRGMKPPENSNSLVPTQFSNGKQLGNGSLRMDENASDVGHYTDEQRQADRDRYIKHRRQHQEWVRSGGMTGKSLKELYPQAFE